MTNTTLTLLAAGSLRSAFLPLVAHFRQHTGLAVDAQFGPAGLLRERIEAGAPCAVFASANAAHPQALLQAGLAQECQGFASNQLMLTARRSPDNDGLDWLALLSTPRLRLATSTPGCDPSGDYTWQLFARIEARYPGLGNAMAGRAQRLVGGRDSLSVPPGEIAGAWLIRQNLADLFIGYAHYGPRAGHLRRSAYPDHPGAVEYSLRLPAGASQGRSRLAGPVSLYPRRRWPGYLRQAGFMPFSDAA